MFLDYMNNPFDRIFLVIIYMCDMSKVHGQWHASLSMARKHHRKFLDHVMGTTQKLANQKVQRKENSVKTVIGGEHGFRARVVCGALKKTFNPISCFHFPVDGECFFHDFSLGQ